MSIGKKLVTMINYNNYNNYDNYTTFVSDENKQVVDNIASLPVGGERNKKALGVALMPQGTLPPKWRGVKIDLFANPRLKLKFTILRHDNTKFQCVAGMNSPNSYIFRGREHNNTDEHWNAVENIIKLRKHEVNFRISKLSKPRKGGTLHDLSVALYKNDFWTINLIYDEQIYQFQLKNDISDKFKKANGIATTYYGITSRPWATKEELGI